MAVYQVGQKFRSSKRKSVAVFKCDCGKTFITRTDAVPKSCGCLFSVVSEVNAGAYRSWIKMRDRCLNENHSHYLHYGGRGITICDRWERFENFVEDMGPRPIGLTLDRVNNDLGYNPDNCKWSSMKEQNRNKTNGTEITIGSITMSITEWSEQPGTSERHLIYNRIRRGWCPQTAVYGKTQ